MTEGLVRAGEGTALRKLVILADSIFHLARLETLYDLVTLPRQLSVCYRPRLVISPQQVAAGYLRPQQVWQSSLAWHP
jgi:hypothetical protein